MIYRLTFIFFLILSLIHSYGQSYTNPVIRSVLVNPGTNRVNITFTGSNDPTVVRYIVSKWLPSGNNQGTTGENIEGSSIFNNGPVEYHIENLNVPEIMEGPVGFTIRAFNDSVNIHEQFHKDSTIFLQGSYDSCNASVDLRWNDYNTWRGQIDRYIVVGYNSAGSYILRETIPGNVTQATISELQANNDYHFYIVAWRDNPADSVTSIRIDFSTPHAYYPEYINADFGTVNGSNPHVQFTVDPQSELNTYELARSTSPAGNFETIETFNTTGELIEYTDSDADASQHPFYYRLSAINYCGEAIRTSDLAGTIYLNANLEGFDAHLNWTNYFNWPAGVSSFDIERMLAGEDFEPIGNTTALAFTDNSLDAMREQRVYNEVCYRITAHENTGSTAIPFSSASNIVCIDLPENVRFEFDAFVPGLDGFSTFGPEIDFLPARATFRIFNRYGNLVFRSDDLENLRWDGRIHDGDFAPEGVYRYEFEYENEPGSKLVIHGSVTVVRQ